MKRIFFVAALAGIFIFTPESGWSQTSAPAAMVSDAAREKATLEKHLKPILAALNLNDAEKVARTREMLAAHLQALNGWHAQNDAQIKSLWNEFNAARAAQNPTNADAALAQIEGVYASFQPPHKKFLADLATVLTPAQIESVKDTLTINKVQITFNAYGEIFPGLTVEQRAFILKNLQAAREEAMDAGTMPEKSAFFKKFKIKIESYLTAQGYDVKQAYKDFVAKQKAAAGAKKDNAAAPPTEK